MLFHTARSRATACFYPATYLVGLITVQNCGQNDGRAMLTLEIALALSGLRGLASPKHISPSQVFEHPHLCGGVHCVGVWHFFGFTLSPASFNLWRTPARFRKCSWTVRLKTVMSSIYTIIVCNPRSMLPFHNKF